MISYYDQLEREHAQASAAMDCLRKLADGLPDPVWRMVARCGYIGCGGKDLWRDELPQEQSHGTDQG